MRSIVSFFALGLLIFLSSCGKDDQILTGGDVMLEFSTDTLRFDTIFSQLGSATRSFKIYNPNDQRIRISSIALGKGEVSKFRINVDGIPADEVTDVEIAGNDSIYIFSEVTIDPNQPLSESPFVITEEVVFETNGNEQRVVLEAWGQNANYIPSRFGKGGLALLSCDFNTIVWDDPKPYVIYGFLLIDSCTLQIPAGQRVYVHGGIARTYDGEDNLIIYNDGIIYALPNGKVQILGTEDDPVIIQGDRLEDPFQELEGQWVGIRLASTGNLIEHATIKNSLVGVYVDSSASVVLDKVRIFNTSGPGIFGSHATIQAENCLVYNNAGTSVQLGYGGNYSFDYCTFASYGVQASALSLSNGRCLDPLCSQFATYPLTAQFRNSIIFGSTSDEISLSDFSTPGNIVPFNIDFDHCLVKVRDLIDPNLGNYPDFLDEQCVPCINGSHSDPVFLNLNEDDYHLDSLSIARGQGIPVPGILTDLEGNERDASAPDLGAFEYQEE